MILNIFCAYMYQDYIYERPVVAREKKKTFLNFFISIFFQPITPPATHVSQIVLPFCRLYATYIRMYCFSTNIWQKNKFNNKKEKVTLWPRSSSGFDFTQKYERIDFISLHIRNSTLLILSRYILEIQHFWFYLVTY